MIRRALHRRDVPRALTAVLVAALASASGVEPPPLEFHRVHVPAGRLGDVPLGGGRYVPMPLAEFEAAVARAAAGTGGLAEPVPPATSARCRATIDEDGALVGTVSCAVGAATAGPGRSLPLGLLRARRGLMADDPPRPATICGRGSGLAIMVPEPGTYEFEFTCVPEAEDAATFRLPLVPALTTSLVLDLPPGLRPVLSGPAARHAIVSGPIAAAPGTWRIELGPAAELAITVAPPDRSPATVAVWSDVALAGPRATLAAVVVPATPWRTGRFVLDQDPALRVTEVRTADGDAVLEHETAADGRSLAVTVPRWLDGHRSSLVVRGIAPATGPVWRLPLVRAGGASWAGGGSVVRVDPAFAVSDVEVEECRVVPPDAAAAWPRADRGATGGGDDATHGSVYHVEQQGPSAALGIEIGPRAASFDVARVTTVDITPGAVLGRAACDVRVTGGEAFEITGRVAAGWIIDSVDAVDDPGTADDGGSAPRAAGADRAIDWRVVPSPAGDALRIGLAVGATGRRGIGLRITGHRAGLAPGAAFTTADIDMVRFDGEGADGAVIDLRTGPDAFVEIAGRPAGWFDVDERLAALAEEGRARGRIRGGERAADVEARVVRRRPPLDVRVEVRLEPRPDALVQTFTFDCRGSEGVESLVVDFAEPGGAGLAWRVESPAGIQAAARPLEPAEGGLATRSDAIAASWLVELSPPAAGPVRIRAVRSVPFAAAVPVPLAWVDGAIEPGGTVSIAAAAGSRPRLVNRRLRELPADPGDLDAPAEFAYGAPLPGAAAEFEPVAPGSDARAWAWRETVACWCDESGATESESRFEVENDGRSAVTLSLAPGRRLDSVLVGGVAPQGVEFGPAGGTWLVPLPEARRRVDIVVRTLAAARPGRGAWLVNPVGCSLDLPVLDRDVRLLVPPGLVVAASAERLPWTTRLLGVSPPGPAQAGADTGYRRESVAAGDRGAGVVVVRRRLVNGAAILAAVCAGIICFSRVRDRPAWAWPLLAAAAVAALWVPAVGVPVARAAWWGALAGAACARWHAAFARRWWPSRAAVAGGCLAVAMMPAPAVAAAADLRVFVTPGDGGETALVPEPLFRRLAAAAAPDTATIRVIDCRIMADRAEAGATWRMTLDLDADAAGVLVLDVGPGARWLEPPPAAGIAAVVEGRAARLTAATAGRHTVELAVAPAVDRRGAVETTTAWIPVAPSAVLRVAEDAEADEEIACERSAAGGPFRRAPVLDGGLGGAAFDVSVADRVRIVRAVDPRDVLATAVRVADTVNVLEWNVDGCRVDATCAIDTGAELLRAFAVRIDPRLEDLAATMEGGAAPRLVPLGAGRMLVELPEAVRGRLRVRLVARLPLADAVGVFDAPAIWLAGVAAETRTLRLSAAPDLEAALDPAPVAGATAADGVGRQPARVVVRRRRGQVRGTQRLAVVFAPTGVGLALEAQIDAATAALARIPIDVPVGCSVDRVSLTAADTDGADRREPIDVTWRRTAADRVMVLVQRPRPGRFRLEVEARLAQRPAPRARLPVVRAQVGSAAPLLVTWMAEPPLAIAVQGEASAGQSATIEVSDGAPEPEYELVTAAGTGGEPATPPTPADVERASRVERAEVRAALDARGRVHGIVRFDVVAGTPAVRLRLPPGMRLFDVLVDGHVVAAEPRAVDAWDVPLGSAPWPRTILVVFAGDVGAALAEGRPLALAPPRLEGLPVPEVLWSLRPPAGRSLTVAPPARPLGVAAASEWRAVARDRVAAACERSAIKAAGPERQRLERLAALRREDSGPAAEERWWHAAGWRQPGGADAFFVAAEPVVLRAVPVTDGTAPARMAATVALVAAGSLAWTAAARRRRGAA